MKKRVISCILAALLTISLATGCSKTNTPVDANNNPSGQSPIATQSSNPASEPQADYGDTGGLKLPLVDKPVTITTIAESENPNLNDSWAVKELEKRTGINLELTIIPSSALQDKTKIMAASGNMTDIFPYNAIFMSSAEINNMGAQGIFVAINKYSDMLPNFKKTFYETYPWVMKSYTAADDNLYFYPKFEMNRDVNHGYMYRKDIFDKNGLKMWTNTEEFYNALKKLKEIYPDSYPLSSKSKENIYMNLGHGWGFSGYPAYYDEASSAWKFVGSDPNFLDMIKFMQKLYTEKLLDPEFLTDTPATWTEKMVTGKSTVTWDWIGRMELFYTQVKDTAPEFDLRYANPIGPVGKIIRLSKVEQSLGFCITNNENKEISLKLVDYLSSPSGTELMTMGQEGITYNVESDGSISYVGFEKDAVIGIKDLEEKFGLFIQPCCYNKMDKRSVYFKFSEREKEAQDMMLNNNKIEEQDPIVRFTDEENEVLVEIQVMLKKSCDEFASKFILNPAYGEAEWKNWLNEIQSQADEMIKLYNAAQVRYDSQK